MVSGHEERLSIWHVSAHMLMSSPWFGTGSRAEFESQYEKIFKELMSNPKAEDQATAFDAHNTFLAIACQYGLPALLFYVSGLISILLYAFRMRHERQSAFALTVAIVVCSSVCGMSESLATHTVTSYGIFLPLGLALGCLNQKEGESGSPVEK